jgi:hypothetical protein
MADAEKGGNLHQEFKAAGREVDTRQPPEEKPFVSELDKLEAERETFTKALDEQFLSGKIDRHEMHYQLQRFENDLSGDYGKKQLKFFEDKDKERAPAGNQGERDQPKGQGDGRTLTFFEDKNKGQDRER